MEKYNGFLIQTSLPKTLPKTSHAQNFLLTRLSKLHSFPCLENLILHESKLWILSAWLCLTVPDILARLPVTEPVLLWAGPGLCSSSPAPPESQPENENTQIQIMTNGQKARFNTRSTSRSKFKSCERRLKNDDRWTQNGNWKLCFYILKFTPYGWYWLFPVLLLSIKCCEKKYWLGFPNLEWWREEENFNRIDFFPSEIVSVDILFNTNWMSKVERKLLI